MTEINASELDRHITGNWGEDQFPSRPRKTPKKDLYGEKPPIDAEIIALTTYAGVPAINIQMADGRKEYFLTPQCIIGGYSHKLQVGTKGIAQYSFGPSYGKWTFKPDVA